MHLIRNLDDLPDSWHSGAVTIGNYDGVHRGHARIVERLLAMARRMSGPALVFTFDPPPARLLRPDHAPAPLTWIQRKLELLEALGVEATVVYPTDRALLELGARQFFDEIIRDRLGARGLVEGPNFFFGHRREGNVETLGRFCQETGIALEVAEPVQFQGQPISSSRIRTAIAAGDVDAARQMLTEPYRIRGLVVHGAGRGATLGYPTANLDQVDTLLPAEGIYAGRVPVDGTDWPAAISIGPNPTFGDGRLKIEVYLIGFDGDLYDRTLEVDFLSRLRGVIRFDRVESLLAQMERDVETARHVAQQEASRR
jgi:riboflavin kinase/FMN adenylyltransferase